VAENTNPYSRVELTDFYKSADILYQAGMISEEKVLKGAPPTTLLYPLRTDLSPAFRVTCKVVKILFIFPTLQFQVFNNQSTSNFIRLIYCVSICK
jgi:hypothetical protein